MKNITQRKGKKDMAENMEKRPKEMIRKFDPARVDVFHLFDDTDKRYFLVGNETEVGDIIYIALTGFHRNIFEMLLYRCEVTKIIPPSEKNYHTR